MASVIYMFVRFFNQDFGECIARLNLLVLMLHCTVMCSSTVNLSAVHRENIGFAHNTLICAG